MRALATALVAATFAASGCAPILPLPAPAPPLSEAPAESPAESPSPTGVAEPLDPLGEADLPRLRATGLLVPVRGAVLGRIEDSFDAPRDGGRRHDAVDILAPRGTPVLAATDGLVLRVGTNALGGNVIWTTDSGTSFAFYYAHLDRYARDIRQGDWVARGTVIGYVGTTGNAPPDVPHLHFQLMRITDAKKWWNGTPLNPFPFLVAEGAATRTAAPERP